MILETVKPPVVVYSAPIAVTRGSELVRSCIAGADIQPALSISENCLLESRMTRRQTARFVGIFNTCINFR